jgi:cytochrome c
MHKPMNERLLTLICTAAAVALATGAGLAAPSPADPGAPAQKLTQDAGCPVCHLAARRHIGPSWQEIAARHRGDPQAAAVLAARVRKGSTGVWGPVPMPPTPKDRLSDAQVAQVVAWVLAR